MSRQQRRLFVATWVTVSLSVALASPQRTQAPTFQVDPFWPKPLPKHWILGSFTGVTVDAHYH
jgi:hypothetical protein